MANDIMVYGHQNPKAVVVEFTYADFDSGTANVICEVPGNAIVINGYYVAVTAWDSGTSAVLDIGDQTLAGVANDDDRYTSTQLNLKTASGATAFTLTGYKYTAPNQIIVTVTTSGTAATAGAGRVVLEYIRVGKADQNSG